jgi:beta-galactosidase
MKRENLSIFQIRKLYISVFAVAILLAVSCNKTEQNTENLRERTSINDNWSFMRYASEEEADRLIYDIRPEVTDRFEARVADSRPTEALEVEEVQEVLKPWIMPSANPFIKNEADRHIRPEGNPGSDFPFVQNDFEDNNWRKVNLPHDWGIEGPFLEGWDAEVGGGMGRLASHGVAWYRRKLDISESDADKSVFLEVEGAMSYAMVWLNGNSGGRLALWLQLVATRLNPVYGSGWR